MIIIIAIFAEKYNHKPSNMTKRPAIVHSRDTYIARIQPFMRTNVVKVMVGHRRVGKSYILYQLIDRIKAEEKDANIIYINKEDLEFEMLTDYHELYAYVKERLQEGRKNYIFIDEIQGIKDFHRAGDRSLGHLHSFLSFSSKIVFQALIGRFEGIRPLLA